MDCKFLIAGATSQKGNHQIDLWRYNDGEEVHTFNKCHSKYIYFLNYFDKDMIVSGGMDKDIKFWSIDDLKLVGKFDNIHSGTIIDAIPVRIDRDGSHLCSISSDSYAALFKPSFNQKNDDDGEEEGETEGENTTRKPTTQNKIVEHFEDDTFDNNLIRKRVSSSIQGVVHHPSFNSIFFTQKDSVILWEWDLGSDALKTVHYGFEFDQKRNEINFIDLDTGDDDLYLAVSGKKIFRNNDTTLAYQVCPNSMTVKKKFDSKVNNSSGRTASCIRCVKGGLGNNNIVFVGTGDGNVVMFDQRKESEQVMMFKAHDDVVGEIRVLSEDKLLTCPRFSNDYISVWNILKNKNHSEEAGGEEEFCLDVEREHVLGDGRINCVCFPNETKEFQCFFGLEEIWSF